MKQPNLLFIYTDEQAFNTLRAYGNSQIRMPNLNRFSDESVVFDEAYVTQSVCTPSRSSLLTGLYPHTNGCIKNNIPLSLDVPCLPEMISEGDYVTAHYGKWHLGDELFPQHGFQAWVSTEDAYNRYFREGRDKNATSSYHDFVIEQGLRPGNGKRFSRDEAARLPEELGKPAFLADRASEFIESHKDDPFILYVNFLEPHMPFFGPRDDQYSPEDVPLPPNFENLPTEGQPLKSRLKAEEYRQNGFRQYSLRTAEDWRKLISNYWGLCSLVDTHVGRILDALDRCGLRENTAVVFTSDHGDMMGSHRLLTKCLMFQEAIRVPMMIRVPGQRKGKRVMGPVSQIDMVPTLLDLMEQPIPDHLEGQSLRPLMESDSKRVKRPAFVEWNGDNGLNNLVGEDDLPDWMTQMAKPERIRAAKRDSTRGVITPDGWKFNCSPVLGEHELYNMKKDPYETRNVFSGNKDIARELLEDIKEWQEHTGDEVELPSV